jgi:hypothetical protein
LLFVAFAPFCADRRTTRSTRSSPELTDSMYDLITLTSIMDAIGFSTEGRRPFETRIADIEAIESPSRTGDAVIVEGVKPPT